MKTYSTAVNTGELLQALAIALSQVPYQPTGYINPTTFKIVKDHPKTPADFGGKQGVVVLADLSVQPRLYGSLTPVQLQATAWAIDSENARWLGDMMAGAIGMIEGCDLCMRGQAVAGGFPIEAIGQSTFSSGNELYFRSIRFRCQVQA